MENSGAVKAPLGPGLGESIAFTPGILGHTQETWSH